MILLGLSLPTLIFLWVFRTYDTREQIQKSEQIIQSSTWNSLLSTGLNLIAAESIKSRCIGLIQLARVRKENLQFHAQIDSSTQNLSFYKSGDSDEYANLRGGMLEGMYLQHVDLTGADLREAFLNESTLRRAILVNADLQGSLFGGFRSARS